MSLQSKVPYSHSNIYTTLFIYPVSQRGSFLHLQYVSCPSDTYICVTYCPIAYDFKILMKLLALRLYPLLPSVIDSDQMGFMPHRATAINPRRLQTNIHVQHLNMGSRGGVASLDIEKAYDTV